MPQPIPSLSSFMLDCKQQYLSDLNAGLAKDWTVVMGNEAADLDSIVSAIAYAWYASTSTGVPHVALVQAPREDLKLRPENLYAFSLASLTPDLKELLCIDDVPLSSPSAPFPSSNFALVDHNRLKPRFTESNPSASVIAIIDHHIDEGLYTDSASPRTIKYPTGSCTSLVTLHMIKTASSDIQVPPELATLLLCGIFIDTNGLAEGGKATSSDHDAAALLLPRSSLVALGKFGFSSPISRSLQLDLSVRDLASKLQAQKSAVGDLSTAELLRRDYKQYAIPSSWTSDHVDVTVGLATVPLSLEYWISRDASEFWNQTDSFMDKFGLDVLGILTTFLDTKVDKSGTALSPNPETNVHSRRQALFIVRELTESGLEERLWAGVEGSSEGGFEQRQFEEFTGNLVHGGGVDERKARAYEQADPSQTRKMIAPLVMRIIEGREGNRS